MASILNTTAARRGAAMMRHRQLTTTAFGMTPARRLIFTKIKNFFMPTMFLEKQEAEQIDKLLKERKLPKDVDQCLFAFGSGENGRLGLNTTEQTTIPHPILFKEFQKNKIVKFVAGRKHFLVLLEDGRVFACGSNDAGQLGIGESDLYTSQPVWVKELANEKIVDIAAGYSTSAAVTEDGRLYTWGFTKDGLVSINTLTGAIAPLGYPSKGTAVPTLVEALKGEKVVRAAMGELHSGCLNDKGEVFTFGTGNWGRLGHGNSRNHVEPKKVEFRYPVKEISMSKHATHLVTTEGQTWGFGKSTNNALGTDISSLLGNPSADGESSPVLIEPLKDVEIVRVDGGNLFSTAFDVNGVGYFWGKHCPEAMPISSISNIVHSSAGENHAGFVDSSGRLHMMGSSSKGQMAFQKMSSGGMNEIHTVPAKYFPGKVLQVQCGDSYTLALVDMTSEESRDD